MSNSSQARALGGLGVWLCALIALPLLPCCSHESLPRRDIVLITVDTLRPDHLGLYGYARDTSPAIDRFFADATIYERAYTTHAATSPSVASLLSGLLPQEHGVRVHYQLFPDSVVMAMVHQSGGDRGPDDVYALVDELGDLARLVEPPDV